jgi:hypothetical protein
MPENISVCFFVKNSCSVVDLLGNWRQISENFGNVDLFLQTRYILPVHTANLLLKYA